MALINLRNALMAGKRTPTAKDYVQDGLVAMWDGIENAGWGVHDANATVWKDLVGSYNIDISGTGFSVGSDYVSFNKTNKSFATAAQQGNATIEIVFDNLRGTNYYQNIIGIGMSRLNIGNPTHTGSISTQSVYMFNGALYYDAYELYQQNYWEPFALSTTSISFYSKVGTFNWNNPLTINGRLFNFTRAGGNYNATTSSTLHIGSSTNSMDIKTLRIYSNFLTADEIATNYAVDKARFNLPDAT